jgi:hypothetical protein
LALLQASSENPSQPLQPPHNTPLALLQASSENPNQPLPPPQQHHQHQHDPSDTTKWYRASPEHLGRVGFITSMSR